MYFVIIEVITIITLNFIKRGSYMFDGKEFVKGAKCSNCHLLVQTNHINIIVAGIMIV